MAAASENNGLLLNTSGNDLESTSEQTDVPSAWRRRGLSATAGFVVLGLVAVAVLSLNRVAGHPSAVSVDKVNEFTELNEATPAVGASAGLSSALPPLTGFQSFCLWVSVVLGTLIGLMASLMAGLGKLVPGHPMYTKMSFGFDKVFGPFFGMPGTVLRVLTGLAEVVGGLCLVIGLWSDALGPSAWIRALIICDVCSLGYLIFSAMCSHYAIDGSPGAPTGPFIVLWIILICRFIVCPPWGCFPSETEWFTFWYLVFIPIPFFLTAIMHWTGGAQRYTYEEDNQKFSQMK